MTTPAPKKRTKAERQAAMLAATVTPGEDLTLDAIVATNIALAKDPSQEELAAWAAKHPIGKPMSSDKPKPKGKKTPAPKSEGLAERIETSLKTKAEPPAAVPVARPTPASGQVWSAASPKAPDGRRYIRIVAVERPTDAENGHASAVEIAKDGTRLRPALLKGEHLRCTLIAGEMPATHRYEADLTASTTTLDLSTDAGTPEEIAMKKANASKKSSSKKPSTSKGEPIRSMNRGLQMLYLKQGTFTGYTTREGRKYAMIVRKAADGEMTVLIADEAERLGRVGHGRTKAAPKAKAAKKAAPAKKAKAVKKAVKKPAKKAKASQK